ncbi:hypothetical protein B9479_000757 [Cryptococcus floricola]|uniref:IgA peptidase M64-domain-containing protein n=1 Tax=Cryptococcus floricola TaxID=2591691 RepID=A0A5D3B6A7_9TREE|nr:hypothetical protein B9479_000757 [Cryptococcus floricola]
MKKHIFLAISQTIVLVTWAQAALQAPFDLQREDHFVGTSGHPADFPHLDYTALDPDDDGTSSPPEGMVLYPLHVSGPSEDRVNLMFFSDGYTEKEETKFVDDAAKLKDDIVAAHGAMKDVAHLINVWATFVPSKTSGVGTQDKPLEGAAFGLYRPGAELRAVFVDRPRRARAACRWYKGKRGREDGGCDQPILLGNDPLYGGLGGEFTVVTASPLNGPVVLRHELGHSLIDVGEEYEGGYAYFGINSEKPEKHGNAKWKDFLSEPGSPRIEDAKVPLQEYPWYDLDISPWSVSFNSSNSDPALIDYPTALLRASVSSIPDPSHIAFVINDQTLDLTETFPPEWQGSLDRRWLEVDLVHGRELVSGVNRLNVSLTENGKKAQAGKGGKMITSLEIIEYGGEGRFNHAEGVIGLFPTYAMDGRVRLRPTNEGCLMRKVNHPSMYITSTRLVSAQYVHTI